MSLLLVDGHLVFPPTEVSVFRDITLYANVFKSYDVLIQTEPSHVDTCYKYLKSCGAVDYVRDFVTPGETHGTYISDTHPCNILARKIWAGNLNRILQSINRA